MCHLPPSTSATIHDGVRVGLGHPVQGVGVADNRGIMGEETLGMASMVGTTPGVDVNAADRGTLQGSSREAVSPRPSCPQHPQPHDHKVVPPSERATECRPPHDTCNRIATHLSAAVTRTHVSTIANALEWHANECYRLGATIINRQVWMFVLIAHHQSLWCFWPS